MGAVEVSPPEVVVGVELTPVLVGNPHAVVVGDPARIGELGHARPRHIRALPRPEHQRPGRGASTELARSPLSVWERGVGETSASGTRSAVAVAAAATHDSVEVLVHFPGGDLRVRLDRARRAWLTGPAGAAQRPGLSIGTKFRRSRHAFADSVGLEGGGVTAPP